MKSILKTILVIIIIAAICFGIFWATRPSQRSAICLYLAKNAERSGNEAFAVKMYEKSLRIDPQNSKARNDAINFYKLLNNVTKVEFHLLNGIDAEPGNSYFYEELCRVYVEQGKLYDAVQLLDNVEDAIVRRKMASSRPQAPEVSPQSGTYRGELNITITAQDYSKIYCTVNGDFPTTEDISDGLLIPVSGEMHIISVCVGQNGLISPATMASFVYQPEVASVTFEDPGVERIIRSILLRPNGDISSGDLRSIDSFSNTVNNEIIEINSVNDLEWCSELRYLDLTGVENPLSCIASMPNLQTLALTNCNISDPSPISELQNLITLDFSGNVITSLAALKSLPNLERLHVRNNAIVDISTVGELNSLRYLDAGNNAIVDISALSDCQHLELLLLDGNRIEDIGAVKSLSSLTTLDISYNAIIDIEPLSSCTSLTTLNISANSIEIIEPLSSCVELVSLTASKNKISAVGPLASLTSMSVLDLTENTIQNADALANCTALINLNLSKNFISDVSALAVLPNLQQLNIEHNSVKNLLAFVDAPALTTIYAFGNYVGNVTALEDVAITVYK